MGRPRSATPTPFRKSFGWSTLLLAGALPAALLLVLYTLGHKDRDDSDAIALALADNIQPDMVAIPGGTFTMGRDDAAEDERPAHVVTVDGFSMDRTEVTNAQFAAFVKATGYLTIAERPPNPAMYRTADPELLVPGSAVFVPVDATLDGSDWSTAFPPWWRYVPRACWRRPEGKGSSLKGKKDFAVIHIAWDDAAAYAAWAQKRLPTEAEWEWAARGGLVGKPYCWGDTKPGEGGQWFANTHQGIFPKVDTGLDGFVGVAPVAQFPPNGFGLYDMSGNVWEWCSDWYDPTYYARAPDHNPPGPERGLPDVDGQAQRVRRGGSYLCDDRYCRRYLPSARDKNPPDSSASHTGFRCVSSGK